MLLSFPLLAFLFANFSVSSLLAAREIEPGINLCENIRLCDNQSLKTCVVYTNGGRRNRYLNCRALRRTCVMRLSGLLTSNTIRMENNVSSKKFRDFLQELPTPGTGPNFDTTVNSNITGLVGKTVHLHCRVKNLGNRTVSWVRHRDIHLLTVGRYTYTSDQRFEAKHPPHTEDWTLQIRYPQKKDSGIYECQISTTPPVGHPVYLTVVEPVTEVLGGPDLFIDLGSTINLTCMVQFAPEAPPAMLWSHNSHLINFDSPRGGISLVTEKGPTTTSRLLIQKAVPSDSGTYSCAPSNANSANVRVHILDGDHPAAMHHGGYSSVAPAVATLILVTTLLLLRPSLT